MFGYVFLLDRFPLSLRVNITPYNFPGDSIQPVDPTENDRIRYRIPPESGEFHIKTYRTRPEFHRIPN